MPTNEEIALARSVLFSDANSWAQHYSNVRLAGGVFFLTSATVLILAARQPTSQNDHDLLLNVSLGCWIFGILFFGYFSYLNHTRLVQAKEHKDVFLTAIGKTGPALAIDWLPVLLFVAAAATVLMVWRGQ